MIILGFSLALKIPRHLMNEQFAGSPKCHGRTSSTSTASRSRSIPIDRAAFLPIPNWNGESKNLFLIFLFIYFSIVNIFSSLQSSSFSLFFFFLLKQFHRLSDFFLGETLTAFINSYLLASMNLYYKIQKITNDNSCERQRSDVPTLFIH